VLEVLKGKGTDWRHSTKIQVGQRCSYLSRPARSAPEHHQHRYLSGLVLFAFVLGYARVIGRVRHVGPPPPLTLISVPA